MMTEKIFFLFLIVAFSLLLYPTHGYRSMSVQLIGFQINTSLLTVAVAVHMVASVFWSMKVFHINPVTLLSFTYPFVNQFCLKLLTNVRHFLNQNCITRETYSCIAIAPFVNTWIMYSIHCVLRTYLLIVQGDVNNNIIKIDSDLCLDYSNGL